MQSWELKLAYKCKRRKMNKTITKPGNEITSKDNDKFCLLLSNLNLLHIYILITLIFFSCRKYIHVRKIFNIRISEIGPNCSHIKQPKSNATGFIWFVTRLSITLSERLQQFLQGVTKKRSAKTIRMLKFNTYARTHARTLARCVYNRNARF